MLLADTSIDEASDIANRLCEVIRSTPIEFEQLQLMVTASFGVSSFTPESGTSWEAALNKADTALYHAKDAGRNRVVVSQSTS